MVREVKKTGNSHITDLVTPLSTAPSSALLPHYPILLISHGIIWHHPHAVE